LLLRSIDVLLGSLLAALPRLRALHAFLVAHAWHVQVLHLATQPCMSELSSAEREEAAELVALDLLACGGTGSSLERLVVSGSSIPLASLAWLPSLTALQELSLATHERPMRLPTGISRLHHLTLVRLAAAPLQMEAGCRLPVSLSRLALQDTVSEAMPPQVSQAHRNAAFSLFIYNCRGVRACQCLPASCYPMATWLHLRLL